MIPATALAYLKALEEAMPLKPRASLKIPPRGRTAYIGEQFKPVTDDTGKTRIVKKDTAPPHVRAGRRRKAGKVTGARAAK